MSMSDPMQKSTTVGSRTLQIRLLQEEPVDDLFHSQVLPTGIITSS